MFEIYDNFTAFDDNKIPYTVSCERHTETANLHAGVTDAGFALKSVGNRFILHTPAFQTGVFSADLTFSYPQEIDPCIQLIFGYCKKKPHRLRHTADLPHHRGRAKIIRCSCRGT